MAHTDIEPALAINILKYFLFAFNFLIWVFGIVLISVGIWIRSDGDLWEFIIAMENSLGRYYSASYLVIICGTLLIIFGFLGCLGASEESPCVILLYNAVTILCIILEVAAIIVVWRVAGGETMEEMYAKDIMWHIHQRNESPASRRFLDLIQLKLECCGAETFVDYRKLGQDIPLSCNSDRTNNVHIRSCSEMLRRSMEVRGGYIGGFSAGLIILQIITLVFNTCLYSTLNTEFKEMLLRHS
ncbi:CD9 antigen [Halotydeus destructor]|nr:CD9 antigen [Halotydeus destructor]